MTNQHNQDIDSIRRTLQSIAIFVHTTITTVITITIAIGVLTPVIIMFNDSIKGWTSILLIASTIVMALVIKPFISMIWNSNQELRRNIR